MQEKQARTVWNFEIGTRENPYKSRIFSGENGQSQRAFRVLHLRPLGQLSVSIFVRFSFQKFAQKFVGEKTGETAKNIRFWDFLCWGISRRIRGTKFPASAEISSQSRYDHFDTSPYLSQHQHLRKRGELMGRTKKNIQLKTPEKPRKIKGFRSGSYRIATTISSFMD